MHSMPKLMLASVSVLAFCGSVLAQPRVIITEIMYNPASNEKKNEAEWIEIANVGDESIEMKDWHLSIKDKRTRWGKFSCSLAPGGVAVLINASAVSEEQFRAAWDVEGESVSSYQIIPVRWGALANDPSPKHPLQLINGNDEVVCEVTHGDDWPKVKGAGGPSIFLIDITADLTAAASWQIAKAGEHGARHNKITDIFDKQDTGSPGYVPGLSTPPATAAKPAPAEEPTADDAIDY
jgi:hypothetical protein